MARPREFDEPTVLAKARKLFASRGYNGTSIDDLVKATGLLRGSLYKAFGSKQSLFERVLADVAATFDNSEEQLDLLTVALKDLATQDARIRQLCLEIIDSVGEGMPNLLGNNLLAKVKENPNG